MAGGIAVTRPITAAEIAMIFGLPVEAIRKASRRPLTAVDIQSGMAAVRERFRREEWREGMRGQHPGRGDQCRG